MFTSYRCSCPCHGDPDQVPWSDWNGWCEECLGRHESGDLLRAAKWELVCLWGDMDEAQLAALNGSWSIRMEHVQDRILTLTKIVGACPWQHIQIRILKNGLYEKVHLDAGLMFPTIDWKIVNEIAARMKIAHYE